MLQLKTNSIPRYLVSLESLYDDFQRAYTHVLQQNHLEYKIVKISNGTTSENKNLKINYKIELEWLGIYSELFKKSKDIFA